QSQFATQAYVDSQSLTAGSGIEIVDGEIMLGYDSDEGDVSSGGLTRPTNLHYGNSYTGSFISIHNSPTIARLFEGNVQNISFAGEGDGRILRITDNINNKGIEYATDYSTNFTDRSLVDKGYVDSLLGSAPTLQ